MAQVILSRAGAALGARVAPVFRTLGRAIGSAIGQRIDAALTGDERRLEGPRLTDLHLQTSEEGTSLPTVFGRARLAGQVIWAARYRETASTQTSGGGKSGRAKTTSTTYSYSLSFAVGLCAGEIARVERVWANGRPLDLATVTHRVHRGGEEQTADPLIEAIDGAGVSPKYRQFILHHAHLAVQAGGVDAFVIGSELRGVTTVRDSATHFPAVDALRTLAADVRAILGPGPAIVYGADWSEYAGHRPKDSSGDTSSTWTRSGPTTRSLLSVSTGIRHWPTGAMATRTLTVRCRAMVATARICNHASRRGRLTTGSTHRSPIEPRRCVRP